jgi:outer membrane protein assembly factor BamE
MLGHTGKTRPPLLALLLCLGLSACSGKIPGAYRIPIQQGNVITVEMLQELKLGMDKRKVRFILGTPLVTDAFHQNRWDYYYSYQPGSGERVQQSASVYFEDDRLIRIDANIDSRIDFHTVTHATENVLIVPRKKKGGFFAALTPAFLEKDEEESAEEKITRSLDSGFNDPQPGSGEAVASGDTATVLDPAAGAAATIGPAIGDVGTPSEIYAPNSSGAFGATAGAWSTQTGSATEVISAETKSQSKYLEDLFKDFGAATIPEAAPVAATVSEPVADESGSIFRNTRD